jgi:hypothetical protein
VPGVVLANTIGVIVTPLQMVCAAGNAVITGRGFTITVAVIGKPTQPCGDVGVMVNVTVTGNGVVLVNVPAILPAPAAAIPVTVATLSLVLHIV